MMLFIRQRLRAPCEVEHFVWYKKDKLLISCRVITLIFNTGLGCIK
jgi:hypothetical protein